MPKGSSTSELKKKREKLFKRPDSAIGRTKNSNQSKTEEKPKSKSGKKYSPAQLAAQKRIAAKKAGT